MTNHKALLKGEEVESLECLSSIQIAENLPLFSPYNILIFTISFYFFMKNNKI